MSNPVLWGKITSEETICMKCQILFSGKNKKNIINLLSAEFTHSTVSVKVLADDEVFIFFLFQKNGQNIYEL